MFYAAALFALFPDKIYHISGPGQIFLFFAHFRVKRFLQLFSDYSVFSILLFDGAEVILELSAGNKPWYDDDAHNLLQKCY